MSVMLSMILNVLKFREIRLLIFYMSYLTQKSKQIMYLGLLRGH